MKKFEMTIAGETLKWEEKSHAQIFRNFWNHYIEKDMKKMKEIIELTNIRTSDSEYFVAQNGSKKRNIPVTDGYWIYTHLSPTAMQRVYDKFKSGMEGTYVKPEDKPKKTKPKKADDITAEPETTDDLAPQATEELIAEQETTVTNEMPTADELHGPAKFSKDWIAMDMFGTMFDDLVPTQKTKVTKTYNNQIKNLIEA